jgi:predicted transcriptional regulator
MTRTDTVPVKIHRSWGGNVAYYRLGNIGFWLTYQRKIAGLTRTQVAERMRFPGGAIKAIEEGRRIPQAGTVRKYLDALNGTDREMYRRFH